MCPLLPEHSFQNVNLIMLHLPSALLILVVLWFLSDLTIGDEIAVLVRKSSEKKKIPAGAYISSLVKIQTSEQQASQKNELQSKIKN